MNLDAASAWQAGFAAGLLDPARPLPAGLRVPRGADPRSRLAVHRNNVVVSLVEALAAVFPVVRRLVGADFFDAMAAAFVRARPPRSPVLADYGDDFADWLESFEPAASLPYLPDVARLERARVRAHHAADARPLDVTELSARLANPAALPQARLVLHPSCRVIVSAFAPATIWAAHQAEADDAPAPIAADGPEAALVLRDPADTVLVVPVAPAAGVFCRALGAGATLGDAAAAAGGFDLAGALTRLIRHGAIVGWHDPGDQA